MARVSNPGRGRRYFYVQRIPDRHWGPSRLLSSWVRGRESYDLLRLVPRLRMSGAIPPFPLHAFIVRYKLTILPLFFSNLTMFSMCKIIGIILQWMSPVTKFSSLKFDSTVPWKYNEHPKCTRGTKSLRTIAVVSRGSWDVTHKKKFGALDLVRYLLMLTEITCRHLELFPLSDGKS
jgi:hypothetical protein